MIDAEIGKVVERVGALNAARGRAAVRLREACKAGGLQAHSFDFLDDSLVLDAGNEPASGRLLSVDGGILAQEFHSLDLFLVRSCGVVFDYESNFLKSHAYFPEPFPAYEVFAEDSLLSHEFATYAGLKRLQSELSCALHAAERHSPQAIILDGSIVPQVTDRPGKDSGIFPEYESALNAYFGLYEWACQNGALLLGVIKDSRGRHFTNLALKYYASELAEHSPSLESSNDTAFLYSLLKTGERTAAFKYSSAPSEQLVLRDLGEWSKKIASFYAKPVEYDRPLRVDLLLDGKDSVSKAANLVNGLSQGNRSYAYPAILIEADLRATLDPSEIEFVCSTLTSKLGMTPELFALRRNSRPFR
ncbi:DNA double-strand break repair nuclease NurA [Candidatus Micrarchaeota archaeon]|nr:DNA double-strand break repair nuclease NurA [Candidatus Micrarchaeota archaeon]